MRITREHATGLVIDMQERLYPHIDNNVEIAERCVILIRGLRILEVPLIVTQQYTKGLGPTIPQIAEAVGTFEPREKLSFSSTGSLDVEAMLLSSRGHFVIILGIEAHVCVLQTVLDIQAQGRTAVVVEDCVSSRRLRDKQIAIERMRTAGAIITTAESLLFELMVRADHEQFKLISSLVK